MRAKEFLSEAINKDVIRMQRELKAAGADLGRYGPAKDGIDGRMGPKTQTAMQQFPAIAVKYKQLVVNVPRVSDAEVAQADHGVKPGQNPNIDDATRARAQASVQDLDNTDSTQIRPVDGRVSSPFGNRTHPVTGQPQSHAGVDIPARKGTPIKAPISGKVTQAVSDSSGACGGTIAISNGKIQHRFCHCSDVDVRVGQQVSQGDIVGLTGGKPGDEGAGTSTGPHLHWEKKNLASGQLMNPVALA